MFTQMFNSRYFVPMKILTEKRGSLNTKQMTIDLSNIGKGLLRKHSKLT